MTVALSSRAQRILLARVVASLSTFVIVFPVLRGDENAVSMPVDRPQTNSSPARHREDMQDRVLIVPGKRVGPAKLGETTDRVYKLIEREIGGGKQIETDSCGSEFIWEDAGSRPQGNLTVGVLNSAVFQVESGTPRYHTPEGIKAYDSPSQVRRAYPRGLRAYSSLNPTVEALGGRPLIFWVDWHRGLAFVLASTRGEERYLYSIIVFKPGGKFCPEGQNPDSPDWHELRPYTLDLPNANALKGPARELGAPSSG